MFKFIKKIFFTEMTFLCCNALKCVSMNNQESKIRPQITNIDSNEPSFYPYYILASKGSESCNNFNDPYANLCVLVVIENMNIKVFNLVSKTNEARHIEWHETCKCKFRLECLP